MRDIFRRCLALVLVLSLVLSTGLVSAFATGSDADVTVLNTDNAIAAKPDADQELIHESLDNEANEIPGFDPDENVVFIVELEGKTLLDSKPVKQAMNGFIGSAAGIQAAKAIASQQAAVQNQITKARTGLEVQYTYQVVLNGLAVSGPYSAKAYLESLDGVASVTVAQTYEYVEPVDGYTAAYLTSGVMIDSDRANAAGYTGKGSVTAILDTGLDLTHEAFQNAPADPALDLADIEAAVNSNNLNAVVTADQLYKSAKIPFAYDYTSEDAAVNDPISHGTHVAGTIGADCETFSGVAPDTQLAIMKVFDDQGSGATSAVIFAALEDAVVLGADAINMSLGTPGGFTSADSVTNAVYDRVQNAGINLMVSAGNETDSNFYNNLGTNLPLVSEPDSAIVGSPSTYPAALSVASVNEYEGYMMYIGSGDRKIGFNDANMDTELDFFYNFDGQTLEYVVVPGYGAYEDYAGLDVAGKIALVSRGDLSFTDKEANAAYAGAVGMIVYDNVEGSLLYMASNGDIPAVFISMADGQALCNQANKTITVSYNNVAFVDTADGGLMSSFSSLGVAPDMTLKPEITAPGGYVFSTLPGGYGSMSGTSMAAPHMAGAAAIMQQYVDSAFASLSETEKQSLINTLLMNTAVPVEDEYGVAYTPRKQGAGLTQVYSAINTGAYVTVDGCYRPKAELGDSPDGSFAKEVTLTIHNISDKALTYDLSSIALTAKEEAVGPYNCISLYSRVMPQSELAFTYSADSVTVAAGSTASVTVKMTLTDAGKASLANFVNGTFLDGYIVLESANDDGIDLSVPYLGFYGDWGQASIFDDSVYDDETASTYASTMALLDPYSGNGYYMGSNFYTDVDSFDINKIAVSNEMLANGYRVYSLLGLLRAPKTLTYAFTDADGNAVDIIDEETLENLGPTYTVGNVIKSFFYSSGGYINYEMGPTNYGWNGITQLSDGSYIWLPDGQYYMNITGQVDGTDSPAGKQTTVFPIAIDSQAPQLVGHDFEEVDGVPYVTLSLYDENYVMAFQIISPDGETAFSSPIPVDEAEAGTVSSFTFDVSGLLEAGYTSAAVIAFDYALNEYTSYEFSLDSDMESASSVTYSTASLSLAGDIGINYYMILSEDIVADAGSYMKFTVAGKDQIVPVSEALVSTNDKGETVYRFSCKVAAKQMADTITSQMYTSNGPVGDAKDYSVKAYCTTAISMFAESDPEMVAMMKAMLNYGGCSQLLFDYSTDALANAGLDDTSLPALTEADLADYVHSAVGSEDGIAISTVSLLLESTTSIRFYFTLDGTKPADAYTFYVDGVEAPLVQDEKGQYYVQKYNIAAKNLDEMVTVTVGGLTVRYGGLSYVRQVAVLYPDTYGEELANTAKALYVYNQTANAYFQ